MGERVKITEDALAVLNSIKEQHGASLLFHQSGGCCDGSAPMLLSEEDFFINETDVLLGIIGGVPFYMSESQYDYWKHTQLTIDIVKGRGASFSLEIPLGLRFITKSKLMANI